MQVFECVQNKSFMRSGRLWIFAKHLCFYSNLFGNEQKITIRASDIITVKSAVSATIEIETKHSKIKFSSFNSKSHKDNAVELIQKVTFFFVFCFLFFLLFDTAQLRIPAMQKGVRGDTKQMRFILIKNDM